MSSSRKFAAYFEADPEFARQVALLFLNFPLDATFHRHEDDSIRKLFRCTVHLLHHVPDFHK